MRWVGPFDELAGGDSAFALALRREFRDDGVDDQIDKDDSVVVAEEMDDFVSFLVDYVLSS